MLNSTVRINPISVTYSAAFSFSAAVDAVVMQGNSPNPRSLTFIAMIASSMKFDLVIQGMESMLLMMLLMGFGK